MLLREAFLHPAHQVVKILFAVIPPPDARLIGYDNQKVIQCLGGAAKIENAIRENDLFRSVDITGVSIDHAVAIEKKRFACSCQHLHPHKRAGCLESGARQ